MEIKTAFEVIVGILMLVAVIVAGAAIMSGLLVVTVEECNPASYTAQTTMGGETCGYDVGGNEVKCILRRSPQPPYFASDKCIDEINNLCCPLGIKIRDGKCCDNLD